MKYHCDMVADLLPGYLDNTCSAESRAVVEAHLASCQTCRAMLEELQEEPPEQAAVPPAMNEAAVLKKTSWVISKRAISAAAGVTAIVIWWLVYFWQEHLSNWGDYRYFSYTFHELWVTGLMIVPLATFIWLLVLLRRSHSRKTWRKNGMLLIILTLFMVMQTWWFSLQSDMWSTTTFATVEITDESHIRLRNNGEESVLLEVPPVVMGLLVEEEKVYSITYTHRGNETGTGRLINMWVTDLPVDIFE